MKNILALSTTLLLVGCTTITENTTQSITVEVSPDTGTCVLSRRKKILAQALPVTG